ncbi:hypothetical protein GZH47_32830 (plasmid) [Paenibacillus rhizovicinus]|uniref:Uncharacterized protein n=1 Tax=Paenibacillus rhizovicinus TaxID=2704463 RepID=A0A6C0PBF1_9BACL|nr:hypothetical protein [Paenibacillus rhizovicinus]QHW35685.1 hypothetical protein GZH47_32830 [Paenibacillus rhizovicinus]
MSTGPKTEAGKLTVSQNLNPTAWTLNPDAVAAIDVAKRMRNTKHGLYASVPIICKGQACPYRENCFLYKADMAPVEEKCPIEIAAIEDLYDRYCEHFKIKPEDPRSTVDLIMIRELVDIGVTMLRCDNKMAIDADFIIQNTIGMTEDSEPITKSELHPVVEYKEKLRQSLFKTMQLMNSTRKDKEGTKITVEVDPSQRAAEMLKLKTDVTFLEEQEDEAEKAYYARMNGSATVIEAQPIGFEEGE